MRAVLLIASNTFREAIRQKLIILMGAVALALVLASRYLMKIDMGHGVLKFISDFGSGALGLFGSIIAVTAACQLVHSEIETRTLMTLRSKPVGFSHFVFGKLCGVGALLGIFTLVISAATMLMIFFTQFELSGLPKEYFENQLFNPAGFCAWALLQWVKLVMVCSLAILVCSLSGSLMFSIIVSFMAMCTSLMSAVDMGGADKNWAQRLAQTLFPDLHVFAKSEAFIFGAADGAQFLAALGYGALYAFAACLLAAYCFNKRAF